MHNLLSNKIVPNSQPLTNITGAYSVGREYLWFPSSVLCNNTTTRSLTVLSKVNLIEIARINEFQKLPVGWDSYDAATVSPVAAEDSIAFIRQLDVFDIDVYQTSPGPNGEIMVQVKEGSSEIEFLFYENKVKYITFCNNEFNTQGNYSKELLPELIEWLRADDKRRQGIRI